MITWAGALETANQFGLARSKLFLNMAVAASVELPCSAMTAGFDGAVPTSVQCSRAMAPRLMTSEVVLASWTIKPFRRSTDPACKKTQKSAPAL